MTESHVAVVPVGRIKAAEVESALRAAVRALRQPIELKDGLPLPHGIEDRERGQFRAAVLLGSLRGSFAQLGPGRTVGPDATVPAGATRMPGTIVFVTDADLFTAASQSAFTALLPAKGLGVVSLRRLREAFYRRSADAAKQRARLTKELLRAVARLQGMPECANPKCVLAPSNMLADVDLKDERPCRACSQRMFKGTVTL